MPPPDPAHLHRAVVDAWLREADDIRARCDAAISQLDDAQLNARPDTRMNSVAMLVAHLASNMASRFTDFLSTDGEKPWRDRDAEFDATPRERGPLTRDWARGWEIARGAIAAITPDDLLRTVTIRGEPHSVPRAVERAIAHWAYHSGQILLLARLVKGEGWAWITIPPKGSRAFNARMRETWDGA